MVYIKYLLEIGGSDCSCSLDLIRVMDIRIAFEHLI